MKTYKEFLVRSEPFNPEIISGILWELDISGINEEEGYLKLFSDGDSVKITDIENQLQKLADENLIKNFQVEENILEYKNWNEEWEKKTNVIKVSDSIIIKPTFRDYTSSGKETIIIIDPKMSFGTGEHQTTRLSLLLLQKYTKPGMRIFDIGTGTGVLAIAALKFGAAYSLGIDIDEWSLLNFAENAKLNEVDDKTEISLCEVKDVADKDFDLIAANIQKNVLLEICNDIYSHLKENGILILSGLLIEDEVDITARYTREGFRFIEKMQMDEWIALVMQK